MSPRSVSAKEIAEDLLERTGKCLSTGDFDGFAECFLLPHTIETFEGRRRIETESELRQLFDRSRDYFSQNGVTELYRHCLEAQYKDDDTIEATHETRVIARGVLIQPPYPVFSIVRRIDGDWKIGDGMFAISQADSHSAALIDMKPEQED